MYIVFSWLDDGIFHVFVLDDNSNVSLSASYHHKPVKSAVFTDDRLYPRRGLWCWFGTL